MKNILLFFAAFFIVLNLVNVSSLCEKNQININTASLEELDKLSGIGAVKAQSIIDSRPFNSVDDLINVVGIGKTTLEKIKEQGLACVSGEKKKESEDNKEEKELVEDDEESENESKERKTIYYKFVPYDEEENEVNEAEEESEVIMLNEINSKDIKSKNNTEKSDKSKISIYGLVLLCALVGFLFLLKKKENEKSEFR